MQLWGGIFRPSAVILNCSLGCACVRFSNSGVVITKISKIWIAYDACVVKQISAGVHELMNISVAPEHQKKGTGKELLQHVITSTRKKKVKRLEVGTGTFGYQLTFYQREGFRVDAIDKDFFLLNYKKPIYEDGIQLKDMLRLVLEFDENSG